MSRSSSTASGGTSSSRLKFPQGRVETASTSSNGMIGVSSQKKQVSGSEPARGHSHRTGDGRQRRRRDTMNRQRSSCGTSCLGRLPVPTSSVAPWKFPPENPSRSWGSTRCGSEGAGRAGQRTCRVCGGRLGPGSGPMRSPARRGEAVGWGAGVALAAGGRADRCGRGSGPTGRYRAALGYRPPRSRRVFRRWASRGPTSSYLSGAVSATASSNASNASSSAARSVARASSTRRRPRAVICV